MHEEVSNPPREVVVITGAAAGVGRATAVEFARRGAAVGLVARDRSCLEEAADEIRRVGGDALVLPADVSENEQVQAAAAEAEQKLGPIGIWVNDAMVTVFSEVADITPEEFKRVTEVTYLGTVWGTMAALKCMMPRGRGCIVQVGSALAYRSIPLQSAYCGAKAAIRGFTDSLRTELLHHRSNIHLTMVQLPAVNTPQFDWCRTHLPHQPQPVPPIFDPSVPARAIVWAADHRRRELYLGLSSLMAIEGNKLIPGLLDRYLARTGYDSQQACERVSTDRPDNLFEPVHAHCNARGRFGAQARHTSMQFWLSRHRALAGLIGAVILGLAGPQLLDKFGRSR